MSWHNGPSLYRLSLDDGGRGNHALVDGLLGNILPIDELDGAVGALLGTATAGDALGRRAGLGVDVGHVPRAGGRAHTTADAHVLVDNASAGLLIGVDGMDGAVLGALRLELAAQMDLLDKNEYKFLWITEFPLLEWSDEQNRFTAMHHPFTMPMEEDLDKIDSDPGAVRAQAYDIVLNGNEIGGGSIRIHQDDIQSKMFEVLGFTPEQAQKQFGFLLDAFKYGVPPHAGLAYGLDRLIMLMAGEDSIREVMAFPKVKDASCLMMQAPDEVDPKQLEELGLEVEPQAEEETTEE